MDNEALATRTAHCLVQVTNRHENDYVVGLNQNRLICQWFGTTSYGRNHNNRTTQVYLRGDQFSQSGSITLGTFTFISRIGQVSQHRVEPVSLDSQARLTAAHCWGVVTKALFACKGTLKAARNKNLVDELN